MCEPRGRKRGRIGDAGIVCSTVQIERMAPWQGSGTSHIRKMTRRAKGHLHGPHSTQEKGGTNT